MLNGFKRFARGEDFRRYFYDANGEPHPVGYRLQESRVRGGARGARGAGRGADAHGRARGRDRRRGPRQQRPTRADDAAGPRVVRGATVSPPLCTPYRSWRVCGPQLPSSGGVTTQQVLGMLSQFELPDIRKEPVQAIHLFAEANRLAFADRNLYLGDPQFVRGAGRRPARSRAICARAPRSSIQPKRWPRSRRASPCRRLLGSSRRAMPSERPSTSHFSIVDRFGDAVAMTTSVQGAFGSQLMVGGFILNNQLTDFAYVPTVGGKPVANRVEGGKRPLSSMSPTMLLDEQGRLRLLVGSPGGTRIIGFVAQSIVGVVDWQLDVQQAVAAPHFLAEEGPIELEEGTAVAAHEPSARGAWATTWR